MNTTLLKLGRKLWNVEGVPREMNRRNMRHWVRALRLLGDKWLLAKPVPRAE
jgi:hypothetical protein